MQSHQSSRHKGRAATAMQCGAQGPKQSASDPLYDVECSSHLEAAIAPFQEGQQGGAKRRFEQKSSNPNATQTHPTRQARPTPPHPKPTNLTKHRHTRAQTKREHTFCAVAPSRDFFFKRHDCVRVFAKSSNDLCHTHRSNDLCHTHRSTAVMRRLIVAVCATISSAVRFVQ